MAIAEQQVAPAIVVEVVERIAEVCVEACRKNLTWLLLRDTVVVTDFMRKNRVGWEGDGGKRLRCGDAV